jgi:TnpA family transposase
LNLGDLVEHWTVVGAEQDLVAAKHRDTQLGFALLLKFYGRFGRFPRGRAEFHDDAVEFIARQLAVDAGSLGFYEWTGRTIERHRAEIRAHLGFRQCTVGDAEKLTDWLASDYAQKERRYELAKDALLAECRARSIELPTPDRVERIVRSGLHQAEKILAERIAGRLPADARARLLALVAVPDADVDEADPSALALIKASAGNVSLSSMLTEISRLEAVRAVGLPAGLFADVAPKVLAGWRARAAVESPSHLREHSDELTLTLLAALVYCRTSEVTDALVTLLLRIVHAIEARADRRVTKQLVAEFKRVHGKENLLFRVAEAAAARPDDTVRQVVFPVIGEDNLRNLVAEYKSSGSTYRRTVQTTYRASYSNHYRKGLIRLLEVLEFRCDNSHRPVLDALALVHRYRVATDLTYYPVEETVPAHPGLSGDWAELAYRTDNRGRRRVVRTVYEIRTFEALCDQLKCKDVWVVGAKEFRNPDEDLPADFNDRRTEHYRALRKPLDPSVFIDQLQQEMRDELGALNDAMPLPWLEIRPRPGNQGAVKLSPLDALPEPQNLGRLKKTIVGRWGTVPLIDVLKEAMLRSACRTTIAAMFGRGDVAGGQLLERLLLVLYAYGTNTGIRAVAAGEHGHREEELYYVRRRYLTTDLVRALAIDIANATFTARAQTVWGAGSTTVASDSTHFGAFDQNIFTEWHSRYGGRGVLIYWHVERRSMVIHSQVINCTASEVAAMVDGAMHHGTAMDVEANYTDTHGQSIIGFGLTRLLGFDLLPRIKAINRVRLYRAGYGNSYPQLSAAMISRPIKWELIADQYDQMIKYATAIRTRSAETAAILRRFQQTNLMHPTYQAMLEVGRAQRSVFVARYLRDRELQREINAGLNVSESWNAGNSIIYFGKGGDIPANRRDEQELSVLCLRVLQAAVVYLNTLMVQDVLDEGLVELGADDRRGLTPLFWTNIAPYGEVRLNMNNRLTLRAGHTTVSAGGDDPGFPPTTTSEGQPR